MAGKTLVRVIDDALGINRPIAPLEEEEAIFRPPTDFVEIENRTLRELVTHRSVVWIAL